MAARGCEDHNIIPAGESHAGGFCGRTRDTHQLKYIPTVGVEAGFWWGELLSDPRPVDAFSLVYDSAPLEQDSRDSRPSACVVAGVRERAAGRLVCAAFRCRS